MTQAEIQTQQEAEARMFQFWCERLSNAASSMDKDQWSLADILADGSTRFGSKALIEAKQITLMSPQSIKLACETAQAFPTGKRNQKLKFISHARIKSIPDDDAQMEFFELAQAEGWDDLKVESEIKRNQLKPNASKVDASLYRLDNLFQFSRDFNKLEKSFGSLPPGQQTAIKSEVQNLIKRLNDWLSQT